ncbi:MAG: hypothetical protein IJV06_01130 [Bacteroidaceae bacterium]|nr:hypothetical protein [Bacteroidaceae bacterium]
METNNKKSLTELEKEESVLQKILKKITFQNVLTVLSIIAAFILGAWAAEGRLKIANKVEKLHNDIIELEHFRTAVTLPDSLETTEEVQQVRMLQNRIYAWELAYVSLIQKPNVSLDEMVKEMGVDSVVSIVSQWWDCAIMLQNEFISISEAVTDDKKSFLHTSNDPILNCALNPISMKEVHYRKKKSKKLEEEIRDGLLAIQTKYGTEKSCQKRKLDFLKDKIFEDAYFDQFYSTHQVNYALFKALNIYLLHKEKAIEN